MDRRSNRCPKCNHTYTSRTHFLKCKGGKLSAWHGTHRSSGGGWSSSRRTVAQILSTSHWHYSSVPELVEGTGVIPEVKP